MGFVAALVLVAVVGAVQLAVAVQTWRTPDMDPLDVPFVRMLPLSPAARVALSRAMLSWACSMLSIVAAIALLAVKQSAAAGVVIIIGLLGGGFSMITIALFNQPGFLVPPHRRDEVGLVNGWYQRRAASRRTGQSGEGRKDERR